MAIQAQYPSNILLLNRNGQEQKEIMVGGDYLLQSSQPTDFIHPQMKPEDEGMILNPRKRSRESAGPVNLFSLQAAGELQSLNNLQRQPPVVSSGLGLSFEDHQQRQQKQQHLDLLLQSSTLSSSLSEDLSTHMKNQRDDVDQLLKAQREQLMRTLAKWRERHYRALLGAVEHSASRILKEKDVEVQKAARRNAELEAHAAQLSAEVQVWRARTQAQEVAAAKLQAQIQRAVMFGPAQDKREDVGCSGINLVPVDDAESAHIDSSRVYSAIPLCRSCWKRVVSVVVLPCRHLCMCSKCDSLVDSCPLCNAVRSDSIEVICS